MLRVALRGSAWPCAGFGALAAAYVAFLVAAYAALGDREAGRRDLEALAPAFSVILAFPQRLDTTAGYLAWFGYGQLAPILAFWGALAGTYASRGEDERGLTDAWLTAGVSRVRLLLAHTAAFAVAVAAALGFAAFVAALASRALGDPLPLGPLVQQSLGVHALALAFFAVGLLAGQLLPTRRSALGAAALVLVVLFLVNGFSRQLDALATVRWISPFAYYDRIFGLPPGVAFGTGSLATLVALAAVVLAIAVLAFAARDAGATLFGRRSFAPPRREPSRNPLLRTTVLAALYDQRLGLGLWSAAIVWEALLVTSLADPFLRALAAADPASGSGAQLRALAGVGHGTPYEGFIGFEWFGTLAGLSVAAYAITQVARWSADDADGRLEMVLASPRSRARVVADRAIALALGVALLAGVGHVAIAVGTYVAGETLDPGRLLTASAMLLPVAGVFGGLGAAASAWRPRVAVAALSAFAIACFFLPFAQPVVRAPEWLARLSVFDVYGTPLSVGLEPWRLAVLAGLGTLGFLVALLAIQRRDIGR